MGWLTNVKAKLNGMEPDDIASISIDNQSDFPRQGVLSMIKRADGSYYFTDLNNKLDRSKKYKLLHFYWNGYIGQEFIAKPEKTVTKTKGGVTRALVGGAVAGPVGAVVGASTATTKSKTSPAVTSTGKSPRNAFIIVQDEETGEVGKIEHRLVSSAKFITQFEEAFGVTSEFELEETDQISNDNLDNLSKLKTLLDQGVLTQDEFDAKKKQILGL